MAAISCTTTGWVWRCDLHEVHGSADSESEAHSVAEAHVTFQNQYGHYEVDRCEIEIIDLTTPEPPTLTVV